MSKRTDQLTALLAAPYHRLLRKDGDLWAAEVLELPGCFASGETAAEANDNLDAAMEDWFESEIEADHPIPAPVDEDSYSGRVTLRLSPTVHRRAALRAMVEDVSLNRLLSAAVASYLGEASGDSTAATLAAKFQAILPKAVSVSVHDRLVIVDTAELGDPLDTRKHSEVIRLAQSLGLRAEVKDRPRVNRVGQFPRP